MSAVFSARFEGQCGACGEWFPRGTSLRYNNEGVIVENDCHEARVVEAATGPSRHAEYLPQQEADLKLGPAEVAKLKRRVCPRCFCVHEGEC